MANESTLTVRLKMVSDISDIQSNTSQIQKALNSLKLPDSLKNNFTKIFDDIEKESVKIAAIQNQTTKKPKDVTALESSFKKVNSLMYQLQNQMTKISPTMLQDSLKIDPAILQSAIAKVDELKQKLAEQIDTNSLDQVRKAVEDLTKEGKGGKTAPAFLEALETGKIEVAEGYLKSLQATLAGLRTRLGDNNQTVQLYSRAIGEMSQAFGQITSNGDIQKIRQDLEQANVELSNINDEQLKRLVQAFESLKIGVSRSIPEVRDFGDATVRSTREMAGFNSEIDQIKNRIKYFFGLTNAINLVRRTLRNTFNTIKELDATMTEAAVVTDFSVGDMWSQLPEYTKEASILGTTINDLYKATTLYYQQGLKGAEAMRLGAETSKMARIAGIDTADATKKMTAALRGFNMELNEVSAQRVNDVYSELAAITAADTEQIGTAMSKTASIAASANMEFETTAAFLAQIIETTQEAPETAGTALKTIIARFAEVKNLRDKGLLSGEDEEGEIINVNNIQQALRTVGISMEGFFAGTEGLDSILLKLAEKWETLDFETQRYIATMAAGSRQQSRFIAMMSDYSRTQELVDAATNSAGASQKQYEKTLESVSAKLNQLKNAWDEFVMGLANSTLVKGAIDFFTFLLETLNSITSVFGDAGGAAAKFYVAFAMFAGGRALIRILETKLVTGFTKIGQDSGKKFGDGFKKTLSTINPRNMWKKFETPESQKKMLTGWKATLAKVDNKEFQLGVEKDDSQRDKVYQQYSEMYDQVDEKIRGNKISQEEFNNAVSNKGPKEAITSLNSSLNKTGEQIAFNEKKSEEYKKAVVSGAMAAGAAFTAVGALIGLIGNALDDTNVKTKEVLSSISTGFVSAGSAIMAATQLLKAFGASASAISMTGGIIVAISLLATLVSVIDTVHENAEEKIERLQKEIEETEQKSNDLASSWDSYSNALDVLNDLTRGTKEWKAALMDVNSEVLEILNNYPDLWQYVTLEDGIATLDAKGVEIYQQKLKADILNKQKEQSMTQAGIKAEARSEAYSELTKQLEGKLGGDGNVDDVLFEFLQGNVNGQLWQTAANTAGLVQVDREEVLKALEEFQKAAAEEEIMLSTAIEFELNGQEIDHAVRGVQDTLIQAFQTQQLGTIGFEDFVKKTSGLISTLDPTKDKDLINFLGGLSGAGTLGELQSLMGLAKSLTGNDKELSNFWNAHKSGLEPVFSNEKIFGDFVAQQMKQLPGLEIGYNKAFDNVSVNAWKKLADNDALRGFLAKEDGPLSKIDGELETWFVDQLTTIDLTDRTAIESVFEHVLEADGDLEPSTWNSFRDSLIEAQGAVKHTNYAGWIADITASKELTKKLEERRDEGGSLSKEEYDELLKNGFSEDQFLDIGGAFYFKEGGIEGLLEQIAKNTEKTAEEGYIDEELADSIARGEKVAENKAKVEGFINPGQEKEEFKILPIEAKGSDLETILTNTQTVGGKTYRFKKQDFSTDAFSDVDIATQEYKALMALQDARDTADLLGIAYTDATTLDELTTQIKAYWTDYENLEKNKETQEEDQRYAQATTWTQEIIKGTYGGSFDTAEARLAADAAAENVGITDFQIEQVLKHTFNVENLNKATAEQIALAKALAIQQKNQSKNYSNLSEKIKDNAEAIAAGNKALKEGKQPADGYYEAIQEVVTEAQKVFGKGITENYIGENWNLFEAMLAGGETGNQAYKQVLEDTFETFKVEAIAALGYVGEEANTLNNILAGIPDVDIHGNADFSEIFAEIRAVTRSFDEAAALMNSIYGANFTLDYDFGKISKTVSGYTEDQIKALYNSGAILGYDDIPGAPGVYNIDLLSVTGKYKGNQITRPSGAGGGGSKWTNPYDELYNTLQAIAVLQRQRNQLEEEYQDLLDKENTTGKELLDNIQARKDALDSELRLQQQVTEGRYAQYEKLDKSKYGKYATLKWSDDKQSYYVNIDYDALAKLSGSNGEGAEEFIGKLEEIRDQLNESIDAEEEIVDQQKELAEAGKKEFNSLQDTIKQAIIDSRQTVIDEARSMSETIAETNTGIIESIQASIDRSRQERDNQEKEEELLAKQRQIAYLRQDTSGANALEILQLEKELQGDQKDYTDTLIDQKISSLQEQNDKAQEQRERQIDILQAQLDYWVSSGSIWSDVDTLMAEGITEEGLLKKGSELERLLMESAEFDALSGFAQIEWLEEINNTIAAGFAWLTGYGKEEFSERFGTYNVTPGGLTRFATGGKADFTGPAWLDGTKSRPELVLNQRDTQNFLTLKDTLASFMNSRPGKTENSGGNIYDIDINVESIGSDYDVEQLATTVKRLINEDARYRNNNTINLTR